MASRLDLSGLRLDRALDRFLGGQELPEEVGPCTVNRDRTLCIVPVLYRPAVEYFRAILGPF